jgi:hypothetical protein
LGQIIGQPTPDRKKLLPRPEGAKKLFLTSSPGIEMRALGISRMQIYQGLCWRYLELQAELFDVLVVQLPFAAQSFGNDAFRQ